MENRIRPSLGLAHDAMDSFVAAIATFCERLLHRSDVNAAEIAFSDDWERRQIANELHRN